MITPEFICGGNATFTLDTGDDYYTLHVRAKQFPNAKRPAYFLFQLVDPGKKRGGRYIGAVSPQSGRIQLTTKSWLTSDSVEYVEIQAAFDAVWAGDLEMIPDDWELCHIGRCGVCDRKLTTPESLERGIGPECDGRRNRRSIRRTSHRKLPVRNRSW